MELLIPPDWCAHQVAHERREHVTKFWILGREADTGNRGSLARGYGEVWILAASQLLKGREVQPAGKGLPVGRGIHRLALVEAGLARDKLGLRRRQQTRRFVTTNLLEVILVLASHGYW